MPVAKEPMTETATRDLFPGALEMMIIESLRRQPAHGYALVQHIQQRSNNLLKVEEGSLYPALQRLLKAKLVKAEWGVSSTRRRVRTYHITALGLRHLEQQISSFERMFEGIALVLFGFIEMAASFSAEKTPTLQPSRLWRRVANCQLSL